MLAKALEHWLTNTNELGYQAAFVHALISRGDNVLHSALHRPLEQGKDVVARDVSGKLHAYQLKADAVTVATFRRWRDELIDLVSLPIRQGGTSPGAPFRAYLVTNSRVSDEATVLINDFNAGNRARRRGWARLEVIQREQLFRLLLNVADTLPPMEPATVQQLFNTYGSSGRGMLDREAFYELLWSMARVRASEKPAVVRNRVAGCALVASFGTKAFQDEKNHAAMFEAWALLGAAVSRADAIRRGRDRKLVSQVLEIAWSECDAALTALIDEATERENLLEGGWVGDGGDVYRARATYVLGLACAREVVRKEENADYELDRRVPELIRRYSRYAWLWGESAVPLFYAITKCLELNGLTADGRAVMRDIYGSIVSANTAHADPAHALPNPYYGSEDVLHDIVEPDAMRLRLSRREFARHSACLEAGLVLMARRGMRAEVASMWPDVSRMSRSGFVPANPAAFWTYRSEDGGNLSGNFALRQSWKELMEAGESAGPSPHVWPLWGPRLLWAFVVMPHRWNAAHAVLLDGGRHRTETAPKNSRKDVAGQDARAKRGRRAAKGGPRRKAKSLAKRRR